MRLQNELRQISRRGYAVRMTPQLSCVAVELPVQRDRPRVALAIKGPARSAEIEQWLQVLRPLSDAARDLLAAAESAAAAEAAPRPCARRRFRKRFRPRFRPHLRHSVGRATGFACGAGRGLPVGPDL